MGAVLDLTKWTAPEAVWKDNQGQNPREAHIYMRHIKKKKKKQRRNNRNTE